MHHSIPLRRATTFLFRSLFCLALLLTAGGAGGLLWAQTDSVPEPDDPSEVAPDSVSTWTYDASARLNFSQAAYKDWQEGGGTNSLAFTSNLGGQAARRGERWIQAHKLGLSFGLINQEGQKVRKAEDQILWNSSLRYEGDDFFRLFNPTIAADLRTQFAKGFDYTENPFRSEVDSTDERFPREPPVQNSAFFSPAFITQSLGLTYEPVQDFTIRFGGAAKQTVVNKKDLRVLYGVAEDKPVRFEAGAELASAFDKRITDNIRYRSQLNVFFSFNQTEEPPDARWNNTINLKVNDWLSTDLQFVALFDEDITDAIQLKETISVGVSFTLL
jgi:hypothetical protein